MGNQQSVWRCTYIGLGSNLGDRVGYLQQAIDAFCVSPNFRKIVVSPVYETIALTLDDEPQSHYLNAVVGVETCLLPEALLFFCQEVERRNQRIRTKKWASRTLDLDILLYGDQQVALTHLVIPHPHIAKRRFVLKPLNDLAPMVLVPLPFGKAVTQLLAECPDDLIPQMMPIRLTPSGKT